MNGPIKQFIQVEKGYRELGSELVWSFEEIKKLPGKRIKTIDEHGKENFTIHLTDN